MPLLFLILSGCAAQRNETTTWQRDYMYTVYQQQRAALQKRQAAEYRTTVQEVRGKTPEQIMAIGAELANRHKAERQDFLKGWQDYAAKGAAHETVPESHVNTMLGAGLMLSGAAAGAQTYATPEMPFPQNATIVQPGRPPMYFYGNPMGGGTLIQPGKTPTFIYPY